MAQQKGSKKNVETSAPAPADGVGVANATLRVFPEDRDLVNRAAGARGETVAELFASSEMHQFLAHLMAAATKNVAAQVTKKTEG